jgi:hypothetical protein
MERGPFTDNYLPGNKMVLVGLSLVFSVFYEKSDALVLPAR